MHPNHTGTIKEPIAADAAQDPDIYDLGFDREPENPAGGDQRAHSADEGRVSNLDTGTHHREPENQAPGDVVSQNDARADFDQLFTEFKSVYPRMGDREATEDALRAAIEGGVDPVQILAGARAYAREQEGNAARFIAYSENWLTKVILPH